MASNIAHQAAKRAGADREQLTEWILSLEFGVNQLPTPDIVFLLDLPASSAQQLIARKNARTYTEKAADLQEANADYLEQVRQVYLDLADGNAAWRTIPIQRNGEFRPIEEIAGEIETAAVTALGRR